MNSDIIRINPGSEAYAQIVRAIREDRAISLTRDGLKPEFGVKVKVGEGIWTWTLNLPTEIVR